MPISAPSRRPARSAWSSAVGRARIEPGAERFGPGGRSADDAVDLDDPAGPEAAHLDDMVCGHDERSLERGPTRRPVVLSER